MSMKSCAVTISCTPIPPDDIVKLIVTEEEFLNPTDLEAGITAYPWHIDTKYYSTDIHIVALKEKTLGSETFAQAVEAVVVQFDSLKNEGLLEAEQWEPFIHEFNPEIRILLCDHCEENPSKGISKLKAQEWCIERGYELVELNPEKDEEWEEEQDFLETTGIERIVQALHAHVWPNLLLKNEGVRTSHCIPSEQLHSSVVTTGLKPSSSAIVKEILSGSEGDDGLSRELRNIRLRETTEEGGNTSDLVIDPADALGSGGNTDDFFELFQNLAEMKERVSTMGSDDRKACAEKVVRAFWQAMGGDSDELSDLSDDGIS